MGFQACQPYADITAIGALKFRLIHSASALVPLTISRRGRSEKKIHFNLDATLFAARQNGKYWVTFPIFRHMNNQTNVGLLAGPSFYFLKRCSLQGMLGAAWISQYGEREFQHFPGTKNYIFEQAAISFEVRLFNNFAQ